MLIDLKIQNLAIIESVNIQFSKGMNVLTGETGAGKSILVAALDLLLGGRSDKELVRTGKEEAVVEAIFEVDETIVPILKNFDIDFDASEPLMIKRTLTNLGRTRAYINRELVPVNVLKQLAPYLVDFCKQHEQNNLLTPARHLKMLDQYGKSEEWNETTSKMYTQVKEEIEELKQLQEESKTRKQNIKILKEKLQKIHDIAPQENEEELLTKQIHQLSNLEELKQMAKQSSLALYTTDDSIYTALSHVVTTLKKICKIDPNLNHILDDLDNSLIAIEEASHSLDVYCHNLHFDSEQLKSLQERLDAILVLQNEYGGSYKSLQEKKHTMQTNLQKYEEQEKKSTLLPPIIEQHKKKLLSQALQLSKKRHNIAQDLQHRLQSELKDLAMTEARFETRFIPYHINDNSIICKIHKNELSKFFPKNTPITDQLTDITIDSSQIQDENLTFAIGSTGLEQIEFWLSANKGEELRPLHIVASGGELSRILLALKQVLAQVLPINTLIFDEIDTGVSGTAATLIAKKLRSITEQNLQIITISHTTPIAAEADSHFYVEKQTTNNRTNTFVHKLTQQERIKELARMLSGNESLDTATKLAEQIIHK